MSDDFSNYLSKDFDETKNKIITLYNKEDANLYADQGYRLHTVVPQQGEGGYSCGLIYIMTLETGYADVTRVADAPEDVANGLLALDDGWEIASTSVSAKFWRMIKRTKKPQPRLSVIREALIQIGSIAEDADHKDPSILDQIYRLSDKALNEIDGVQVATVGE